MLPTPTRVLADLRGCWRDYRELAVPLPRRIVYCGLRAGQRCAYWAGWTAGHATIRRFTP